MQKPAGWQEEQAVEIRRDWIAFLADGMGIDTRGATGADLEALVVRTMLEQAVRRSCLCVFLFVTTDRADKVCVCVFVIIASTALTDWSVCCSVCY